MDVVVNFLKMLPLTAALTSPPLRNCNFRTRWFDGCSLSWICETWHECVWCAKNGRKQQPSLAGSVMGTQPLPPLRCRCLLFTGGTHVKHLHSTFHDVYSFVFVCSCVRVYLCLCLCVCVCAGGWHSSTEQQVLAVDVTWYEGKRINPRIIDFIGTHFSHLKVCACAVVLEVSGKKEKNQMATASVGCRVSPDIVLGRM